MSERESRSPSPIEFALNRTLNPVTKNFAALVVREDTYLKSESKDDSNIGFRSKISSVSFNHAKPKFEAKNSPEHQINF
jgi:hypothetical protein